MTNGLDTIPRVEGRERNKRITQREAFPQAVKFRLTEFYDPATGKIIIPDNAGSALITIDLSASTVTFGGASTFNANVTTTGDLVITGDTTQTGDLTMTGDIAVTGDFTFKDSGGDAVFQLDEADDEITFGADKAHINYSTGDFAANKYQMKGNTGNYFQEYFGFQTVLADAAGTNAFRITETGGTDRVQFRSDGGMTLVPMSQPGTPDEGQVIYNSGTNKLNFYNGAAWEVVTSA